MDREALLFDETAFDCCKIIAKNYSTTFYLGTLFLPVKYRGPIYAIYAFLRYADEIVDTFSRANRETLLEEFKADTYRAIQSKLSFNPVLHAYQLVVNRYKIDLEVIQAFFRSVEMNLNVSARYEESDYETYIRGSGEMIGLMCLRVFCENRQQLYDEVAEPMRKLGAALQKVNFLRDMKSDFADKGGRYFPDVYFADLDESLKKRIEEDVEADLDKSYSGIVRLPDEMRSGVEFTYLVYRNLFDKIKNISAESLVREGRVSQSKWFLIYSTKFLYLWTNVLIMLLAGISALCFDAQYLYKFKEIVGAIILSASIFIYWDQWFTRMKVWTFNQKYVLGFKMFGLPTEECLFFVSVPFACLSFYELSKRISPRNAVDDTTMAQYSFTFLVVSCVLFGLCNYNRIYTRVVSFAAIVALALHYYLFQFEIFGIVLLALIVHYVPFFIFDGFLTGSFFLSEPVFIYNNDHNCNVRILAMPIEDPVYSLAWFLSYVTFFEYIQRYTDGGVFSS